MCELGELTRPCGAATPGLARMYGVDTHDVVSVPIANADWTITGDIILKPGKYWKEIPFAETKAGLTDEIGDAVGGGFAKSIPFTLPKYAADSNKWINDAIGARFLVVVADNNDQMILVGSKIAGMRLQSAKGDTGQKQGDVNGWDVKFQAEGTKPCFFYTGAIALGNTVTPPVTNTYDTVIDFTTGGYQQNQPGGMSVNIKNTLTGDDASTIAKFMYNKILAVTNGDSLIGVMKLGSAEVGRIDTRKDYAEQAGHQQFGFIMRDGSIKQGTFVDGAIALTA